MQIIRNSPGRFNRNLVGERRASDWGPSENLGGEGSR